MKSVNLTGYKVLILLVIIGLLESCASNMAGKVPLAVTGNETADLLETSQYLPVPEFDKTGLMEPYERTENPYLAKKGRIDKESVQVYIEARRAFKGKQLEQADLMLTTLTEKDKSLSGPWVMKGDIALEQGKLDAALKHYVEAVKINKDNINAYLRLAHVQRIQGDFILAQNTYAKALSIWPDCPEAHLNLAVLYDVYMNHPLRAQKHMEAYQFLTDGENEKVAAWLDELQKRSGVALTIGILKSTSAEPVS